jgi:hypothetical protein
MRDISRPMRKKSVLYGGVALMKEVRNAWRTWGKICLFFAGVPLLVLYVILGSVFGFIGGMLAVGINGIVWTTLGSGFYFYSQFIRRRLERLKREGLCYDAEILRITQNNIGIRVGATISVYAECSYLNAEEKTCLVCSSSFLIDNFMGTHSYALGGIQNINWTAKVYVSKNNPRDYYVAIYENDKIANIRADYDYR